MAIVNEANESSPFPIIIGDTITGAFSFGPTVQDTNYFATDGSYPQTTPASVQVEIGSIIINADLDNWLEYRIRIQDNDTSNGSIRDSLTWGVNETSLAETYGYDHIQIHFSIDDLTATVFNSDAIPSNLDFLNDFTNGFFSLTVAYITAGDRLELTNFCRSQIISVTKL